MSPREPDPTPFQRRVYEALIQVPAGRVTTYGRLGRFLGCGSAQAIGQALRRNPFAPRVPCHRVVRGDRTLGGFAGETEGVEIARKREMLRKEGVAFEPGGRVREACLFEFPPVP